MAITEQKQFLAEGMEYLVEVSGALSQARSLADIMAITRKAARRLCGAEGATFVLREGELCHYADEDAITPLWKGRRFPIEACVSGWCMRERQAAVVEDVLSDPRVPQEAYATTFVRSLVLVPIREADPIGAIGNYWSKPGRPPEKCVKLLQALANFTAIAIENVQALEALRQSNESLAESLRTRDEFISIAAHELRTPLSSLKLQLQLLGRKIEAQGDVVASSLRSATVISLQQTDRLHHLVENLLDVSSIRLGRVRLSIDEVDLGALAEAVANRQRAALDRAGIDLSFQAEAGVRGSWDALRLEQILVNLFSNAIKYAPQASLSMKVKRGGSSAVLDFQDNGPGITRAHRQKIFERFERANTDERISGLGLGLYLAQNLAQAHGGRLTLEETTGAGARFRLELPLAPSAECRA